MNKKVNKKAKTKQLVVTTIAVGAVGVLGYFGWQYLQKKKAAKKSVTAQQLMDDEFPVVSTSPIKINTPGATSPADVITVPQPRKIAASTGEFPLRKGSKGEKVRELQLALQAKYGASILPKYGADGDFGSETINALKKAGLPNVITESTFNVFVQNNSVNENMASVGQALYNATIARNYNNVITQLKKLQTTSDYTTASEEYKKGRIAGVRQTLVNGLLSTFTNTKQKDAIKLEFLRMGLQYDGKKWSLQGLDGLPIITIIPTMVWINARKGVKVPARMVLGKQVSRRLGYTLFENNGKYFLVPTGSVQRL